MRACLLAVLLCAAGAAAAAAPAAKAAAQSDEGLQLMAEKRYPEAIAALEREARENPGSPPVLLNLGWAYWHAKRLDDALKIGDTLVKLDPSNATFQIFLANTRIERREFAQALPPIERALALAPADREATMVRARALYGLDRKDEALKDLDKVILRFPDYKAASYRKAMYLAEMGRKPEALALLEKLLKGEPGNDTYRRSRAKLLAEAGRSGEARTEWEEIARKDPDAEALMNLGWAYAREKNYDEAAKIAAVLIKMDANNPTFLRFMANLQIEKMHYDEALALIQKALAIQPGDRDASLTLAKVMFRLQREKEAMVLMKMLMEQYPENVRVQFQWAQFCSLLGLHDEALTYYDRLIKQDPTNEAYRLNRAQTLFSMGRFDQAIAEWEPLANRLDPSLPALRRLRDEAFDRRAYDLAVARQERLIDADPKNPQNWDRLARIFSITREFDKELRAAEKSIEVDPESMNGYYLRAESLESLGDFPAAKKAYEDVIRRNPNSVRAFDGLSYVLEAQEKYADALKVLDHVEKLTAPSDSPFLQIHRARLLAAAGHFGAAHELLGSFVRERRPVIPVLLYHGISKFDRSDSIPQADLRAQLLALKKQGYTPITVGELDRAFRGKAELPPKPLVLTFDDGRTDSFENADPILKELGWRATMFVHLSRLRKPHFHASPDDIRKYQATGRWELQSHGFEAHDPMQIDGAGRVGHFLPNRRWLPDQGRLETLAEYRQRLENEYRKMKQGVEELVPDHKVVAFAYPYGDYGQNDYSNTPEAATINQELVRKYFHLAFVQEQFGMNSLASNPTDLRRFEVPRHMTADQLVERLALNDPRVQAQLLDAELWIRANQPARAQEILVGLEGEGLTHSRILATQGAALEKEGDVYDAQRLFEQAQRLEPNKDDPGADVYSRMLEQASFAAAPNLAAEGQEFTDSDTNEVSKVFVRSGVSVKSARLEAWAGEGFYSDRRNLVPDEQHIRGRELGARARGFLTPAFSFDGFYARRWFSEGYTGFADNYNVSATWQAFPSLAFTGQDGIGNVETAPAIRQGLHYRTDGGGLIWDPALSWRLMGEYDWTHFSDDNSQRGGRVRVTKSFNERFSLGASYYRGDSDSRRPAYYTPRNLNQYTGLLTYTQPFGDLNARTGMRRAELILQYEGGYGWQADGQRAVHSGRAVFSVRPLDRLTLTIDAQYTQSPTYTSRRVDGGASVSF